MKLELSKFALVRAATFAGLLSLGLAAANAQAPGECVIPEEKKKLDPVEVGYCDSDAVFVGKIDTAMETMRAYREEGSDRTKHYRTQRSTLKLATSLKGELPEKVTMVAELRYMEEAYTFQIGKQYLIFARKLPGENEFAAASAACYVQPTLRLDEAANVLKQLEANKKGTKKIDCKNIRPK
ncbi:MAG TPA: hypothetical protein VK629_02840 [Steroidobacteraceae bacterium]|nr:hypothetical protein [Steroidobacteraceae bacterium]